MGDPLAAAVLLALLVAAYLSVGRARAWLRSALGGILGRYRAARDANRRAEMLLQAVLSPADYAGLVSRGYLDVRSPTRPSRVYRIPRDGGLVIVRERGRAVGGLCVQARQPIPAADAVAMHKLMIEGAEQEYLDQANHLSIGALYRYGLDLLYDR